MDVLRACFISSPENTHSRTESVDSSSTVTNEDGDSSVFSDLSPERIAVMQMMQQDPHQPPLPRSSQRGQGEGEEMEPPVPLPRSSSLEGRVDDQSLQAERSQRPAPPRPEASEEAIQRSQGAIPKKRTPKVSDQSSKCIIIVYILNNSKMIPCLAYQVS